MTCVRESLDGITGVGGDPDQVPSVGEFYLAFGIIFHGSMSFAYCLSIYFVFCNFIYFFFCFVFSLCTVPVYIY